MDKLKKTLNLLTGVSGRHNRALRDITEWTGMVQKFLADYRLYGAPDSDYLLKNVGDAKFELTGLSYKARPLIASTKNIKGEMLQPVFSELVEEVDNTRRTLVNSSLLEIKLGEVLARLRQAFERLHDTLSEIQYM